MDEKQLLERITVNPAIFAGKPLLRGRRLAVEHVLSMLAAGDTPETILEGYPWLEPEDIRAYDKPKSGPQETVPFEQAVREIQEGKDA